MDEKDEVENKGLILPFASTVNQLGFMDIHGRKDAKSQYFLSYLLSICGFTVQKSIHYFIHF
jgi:hypothetical protein